MSKAPVYLDTSSKLSYCDKCFLEHVYKKTVKTIKHYQMLQPNDKIMLALSGGKDSITLTDIMGRISKRMNGIQLFAVTIDEGVETEKGSYRTEAISFARSVAEKYSIPYKVYSYKQLFGENLSRYVDAKAYSGSACSVCGVFRRRALNLAAKELGATKIATGHNKDDEAQTFLMNVLRGDLERIIRSNNENPEFIPRIKPLKRLFEREIAMYAYLRGYNFQTNECPFSQETVRDKMRVLLEQSNTFISGVYDALLNLQDELIQQLNKDRSTINHCRSCGGPTSPKREICKACEYKQALEVLGTLN
jgi:uncharacterized protein (TIGR00269 family)